MLFIKNNTQIFLDGFLLKVDHSLSENTMHLHIRSSFIDPSIDRHNLSKNTERAQKTSFIEGILSIKNINSLTVNEKSYNNQIVMPYLGMKGEIRDLSIENNCVTLGTEWGQGINTDFFLFNIKGTEIVWKTLKENKEALQVASSEEGFKSFHLTKLYYIHYESLTNNLLLYFCETTYSKQGILQCTGIKKILKNQKNWPEIIQHSTALKKAVIKNFSVAENELSILFEKDNLNASLNNLQIQAKSMQFLITQFNQADLVDGSEKFETRNTYNLFLTEDNKFLILSDLLYLSDKPQLHLIPKVVMLNSISMKNLLNSLEKVIKYLISLGSVHFICLGEFSNILESCIYEWGKDSVNEACITFYANNDLNTCLLRFIKHTQLLKKESLLFLMDKTSLQDINIKLKMLNYLK